MSGACCISGSLHSGTPVGREETVHGLPTYVSDPPNGAAPKALIVMIPDAFGWNFVNLRILADRYAQRSGARILMPEFMDGHGVDPAALFTMDWLSKPASSWMELFSKKIPAIFKVLTFFPTFVYRCRLSVTWPRVESFFTKLRENEGANLKIATTGYCWGGKHAILLCHPTSVTKAGIPLVDCAFTAHPSQLSVPADIEKVEKPLSISVGDVDLAISLEQVKESKRILEAKEGGKHEVVILPGAKHGFSVRGHPDDKKEMEQAQEAEDQAIKWFAKWCGTNDG